MESNELVAKLTGQLVKQTYRRAYAEAMLEVAVSVLGTGDNETLRSNLVDRLQGVSAMTIELGE